MNATDSDRLTALHVACQEDCLECVKLLLDHGADVTALSRHGDTPLSLASRHGIELLCILFIFYVSCFMLVVVVIGQFKRLAHWGVQ